MKKLLIIFKKSYGTFRKGDLAVMPERVVKKLQEQDIVDVVHIDDP